MSTSGSHQLLVTVISCQDTNLRVGASPVWGSDLIRKGCLGRCGRMDFKNRDGAVGNLAPDKLQAVLITQEWKQPCP